jgi:hypothetical protein
MDEVGPRNPRDQGPALVVLPFQVREIAEEEKRRGVVRVQRERALGRAARLEDRATPRLVVERQCLREADPAVHVLGMEGEQLVVPALGLVRFADERGVEGLEQRPVSGRQPLAIAQGPLGHIGRHVGLWQGRPGEEEGQPVPGEGELRVQVDCPPEGVDGIHVATMTECLLAGQVGLERRE